MSQSPFFISLDLVNSHLRVHRERGQGFLQPAYSWNLPTPHLGSEQICPRALSTLYRMVHSVHGFTFTSVKEPVIFFYSYNNFNCSSFKVGSASHKEQTTALSKYRPCETGRMGRACSPPSPTAVGAGWDAPLPCGRDIDIGGNYFPLLLKKTNGPSFLFLFKDPTGFFGVCCSHVLLHGQWEQVMGKLLTGVPPEVL